nr:hypothetical protein CPBEC3_20900 [Clostridium perfringens]
MGLYQNITNKTYKHIPRITRLDILFILFVSFIKSYFYTRPFMTINTYNKSCELSGKTLP